jgi:hypothetical protein
MNQNVIVTGHAYERIEERLSIKMEDVIKIIEGNICVPIGRNKSKVHKLFFSIPDNEYFVAICHEASGKIITILPKKYHKIFAVPSSALYQARELAEDYAEQNDIEADQKDIKEEQEITINFFCYFKINESEKPKIVAFELTVPSGELADYLQRINNENLQIRKDFMNELIKSRLKKDLKHDTLQSVFYRFGGQTLTECSLN